MTTNHTTTFEREERYIVVKIKDIENPRLLEKLRHEIHHGCGVDTVECVVVESDWPEYETVWGLIKDRVEGRPNELERLRAEISELRAEREAMAKQELDCCPHCGGTKGHWEGCHAPIASPVPIPEWQQITGAKRTSDQSVELSFTSCRAASAFLLAAAPKP